MYRIIVILSLVVAILFATNCKAADTDALMLFCGAALKKPMDDIVALYQEKTGMRVNVTYAGVGTLFSQILLSKQGDIFVAPSPDIMERAKRKGVIASKSIQNIAYIVPCINTQKGNPKKFRTLKDLTKPGIRVGLANPEIVYVGALAQEIITKNLSAVEKDALNTNVVTYVEDFNKLSNSSRPETSGRDHRLPFSGRLVSRQDWHGETESCRGPANRSCPGCGYYIYVKQ